MANKKTDKELAESYKEKGFYETHADFVESLELLSYSTKIERLQERMLNIYKKQLNKKSS